ncbi:ankyrin repeat-containing domain protein [Aspergillus heterothallicus]
MPPIPPRPRAARFLDLPREIILLISRFLSTKSLLSFVLVNREINSLCTLVLETPHPRNGDLQRAIEWHTAVYTHEERLLRILKNSRRELMKDQECQYNALTFSCLAGFTTVTQWLLNDLSIFPDIRHPDPEKQTRLTELDIRSPLLAAAIHKNLAIVSQLLMTDADLTGYDLQEVMSLLFHDEEAEEPSDMHVANMLVLAGLNLDIRDEHGAAPIHHADSGLDIRFLVEHGIDVYEPSAAGITPFAYAIYENNVDTMETLMDLGVEHDRLATLTQFPLHLAAEGGGLAAVDCLLDAQADPNIRTPGAGRTPFHYASLSRERDSQDKAISILQAGGLFSTDAASTRNILVRAMESGWRQFLWDACATVPGAGWSPLTSMQPRQGPVLEPTYFFMAAASTGNIPLMQSLIHLVDVDFEHKHTPMHRWGCSALGQAVEYGGDLAVAWLIRQGNVTRFDFLDDDLSNLYHIAMRMPHPERQRTIELLLDHLDPDELITPNEKGETALEIAIKTQPYQMLHQILSQIPPIADRLVRRQDYAEPISSCLSIAAAENRTDVLQLLHDFMQYSNLTITRNHPPLLRALKAKRAEAARWLMDNDIGLDMGDNGVRPIAAAAALGFNDVITELLDRGIPVNSPNPDDRSALAAALAVNNLDGARILLSAGINPATVIDGDDDFGDEPSRGNVIRWAAAKGRPEAVLFLLQHGYDVNGHVERFAKTPLAHAAANNRTDSIRHLITAGADLELCDTDGFTPLYWAARGGHADAVRLLLDAGAEADPFDTYGNSPLINAASRSYDTVRLLVEAGADVNEQSNAGSTALINAAARDQAESVRLLIERGAEIEVKARGQTALSWAIANNAVRAARVLVEKGADVTAVDGQGRTPLALAPTEQAVSALYSARDNAWQMYREEELSSSGMFTTSSEE